MIMEYLDLEKEIAKNLANGKVPSLKYEDDRLFLSWSPGNDSIELSDGQVEIVFDCILFYAADALEPTYKIVGYAWAFAHEAARHGIDVSDWNHRLSQDIG